MAKTFYSERRTTCKSRQKKKHINQMTTLELLHCRNLLQYSLMINDKFILTKHTKDKLKTFLNLGKLKGMIYSDSFNLDNIIEYNETVLGENTYKRVLVRHPEIVTVENQVCYQYCVIEIQTGKIITVYYNKIHDSHKTLDLSYYDENLKIIKG